MIEFRLAKQLQIRYSVVLIDPKSHFLCLPSLPACVCDPTHVTKIRAEHDAVSFCPLCPPSPSLSMESAYHSVNTQQISPLVMFTTQIQYLKHCQIIKDTVDDVDENRVHLKDRDEWLCFDYLMLCTGSRYRIPFKSKENLPPTPTTASLFSSAYLAKFNFNIVVCGCGVASFICLPFQ